MLWLIGLGKSAVGAESSPDWFGNCMRWCEWDDTGDDLLISTRDFVEETALERSDSVVDGMEEREETPFVC